MLRKKICQSKLANENQNPALVTIFSLVTKDIKLILISSDIVKELL